MIEKRQIKGLEKLVNSDIIKNIYPIIGKIEIDYQERPNVNMFTDLLIFNIYLNDPDAYKENLWDDFQFDHHYLIDHHIRKLLPYLGIDNENTIIRFNIYDTRHNKIISNLN